MKVYFLLVDVEILAFSSFEKVKMYLENNAEEFLLSNDNIQELLETNTYSNDYANFVYAETEVR